MDKINASPIVSPGVSGGGEIKPIEKKEVAAEVNTTDKVEVSPDKNSALVTFRDLKELTYKIEEAKYPNEVHLHPEGTEYENITRDDAAKMVGYFTQKLQDTEFPWALKIKGFLKRKTDISEMEALNRLQKGEEVLFCPMRVMNIDLSAGSLESASVLATPLAPLAVASEASKKSKISAGLIGRELSFGEPIPIHNFQELKLLFQMHDPEAKIGESNAMGKGANMLSYFAQKTLESNYPFKFYSQTKSRVGTIIKGFFSRGLKGAVLGGIAGAILGGPIGGAVGTYIGGVVGGLTAGATVGGVFGGVTGAKTGFKGKEINAFETLDNILDEKPVLFQEKKKHELNIPIFGKYTWYTDYHKGSSIASLKTLEEFHKMQSQ